MSWRTQYLSVLRQEAEGNAKRCPGLGPQRSAVLEHSGPAKRGDAQISRETKLPSADLGEPQCERVGQGRGTIRHSDDNPLNLV